jgi:isochorismate pyruvate lyase
MKFVPCNDMTDVRANIDRIDRMLVRLLAERQCYIDEAARIKDDRNVVRDNARVEDVVAKVKAASEEFGFDAEIADKVWRTLIECCIQREFVEWDKKHGE